MRKLPVETEIIAVNNLLVGAGAAPEQLRRSESGNVVMALASMVVRDTLPSHLPADFLSGKSQQTIVVRDPSLRPVAEFSFPLGTTPLLAGKSILPGAFQN
jgi:hypothetical protein